MSVTVISTVSEVRAKLGERRLAFPNENIVLVPTMGALHEGHGSLIREARRLAGEHGTVAVSVFVNPTQFGPNEDFEKYPRALEKDTRLADACGADIIFAPKASEMYAEDASMEVRETRLSLGLCGTSRPGHFPGVCLVVMKLFGIVQPDQAVFGAKDYQQLAVIRRMVRDLHVPVEIVGAETVREADGLAMSSRNENLTETERAAAPGIRAALLAGKEKWEAANDITPAVLTRFVRSRLEQVPGGRVDYLELVDAETLEPATQITRPVVLASAFYFSQARLIDNIVFGPEVSP